MKKIAAILIVALGFTSTTIAQEHRKEKLEETLTVDQQTELAVKKMTLKLDLTASQQEKIKPLLAEQITERKAAKAKRKEMRKKKQKPSSDEHYKMMTAKLDKQIAFKSEMKHILDTQQYDRFEKMSNRKMQRIKKKMHKKGDKHRKMEHDENK
ncbi:hypothetical protein SAMN04489761_4173 [Tenacibaculum sp. MAR_2009_124]|uniref:hypothetical protein n=1 Tax=Tenacibaculum sp. MAR_2009_124 TaxID=1250059 RepID=UPI00089C8542|nr:hypothetical protein [Tenacibaculum sp. MAR_2009_124]SED06990.1 hypothetical protein SAMN04489761_4173 [Tenacibaculum sp. MAR_2009_124]